MKTTTLILFLSLSLITLKSQNISDFDAKFDKAKKSSSSGNFEEALSLYLQLYQIDAGNANINYLIGYCYTNERKGRAKAIPYLEKAKLSITLNYKEGSSKERNAPILTYRLLGDIYHTHSKFDLAIQSYERYKHELFLNKKKNDVNYKYAERQIEMCLTAKELVANPVKVRIENMGKGLNSPYADYSPVLTADQSIMIFTTRRPESTGGLTDSSKYFEDIFISYRQDSTWSIAQSIGKPINTDGNEASVGISPDGQEILIYKDDNGDGNIYSTTLNGDTWSTPIKLNENINSKYWEPSAFISADGHTIYFVSDRPGGFGGRDIYTSEKGENGEWGKAKNMGNVINTQYDEDAPFIHPDGVTLFFSSNGHKTMGGFDVFYTSLEYNGTKWLVPVNVGYPVNSPEDDVFYVVSPDKTKAYYSSFKVGGYGEKDNFMITFLDQKQAPLTVLKGVVKEANGSIPPEILITVTDNETGNIVGVYKTNSKTGQYLFILTPGKNYNISYEAEGFLFYSENRDIALKTNYYEVFKAIQLPPIIIGSKITLNNIFFDFDKATLRKTSTVELNNILRLMNKYPKIVIEIAAYTDSKGTVEYNLNLSKERAQAVVDYLITHKIPKERMASKGHGESYPDALNQNADGSDNPAGRQLNRRAELKIIGIN